MTLNGNGTRLRLILGGGERLDGQATRLRGLSATTSKSDSVADKRERGLRSPVESPRLVVC